MNVVLAEVQAQALDRASAEIAGLCALTLPYLLDVSQGDQVEALAYAALDEFRPPHVVFNNAGVAAGGLVWESNGAGKKFGDSVGNDLHRQTSA